MDEYCQVRETDTLPSIGVVLTLFSPLSDQERQRFAVILIQCQLSLDIFKYIYVDGHRKGWPHWPPLSIEGVLLVLRDEADPGDEYDLFRRHDGALNPQRSPRFDPDHVRNKTTGMIRSK